MSRTLKCLAVLVGVVGAVSSVFAGSSMPFSDSFGAAYTNNQPLNGTNGWGSDRNGLGLYAFASATAGYEGQGAAIPTVVTLSNVFNLVPTQTNVWTDFYVKPVFYAPEAGDPGYPNPVLDGQSTAMFFVNTNGYLVVAQLGVGVTNWIVLNTSKPGASVSPIAPNTYVRISLNNKYGADKCAIMLNGLLLREGLDFINPAPSSYEKFQVFNGSYATTYVDNVYIQTSAPLSLSSDYDGDGMRDAWEIDYTGTIDNSLVASGDNDGDNYNNGDESWAGSNPFDPSSVPTMIFLPFSEPFEQPLVVAGNLSGQHCWGGQVTSMVVEAAAKYQGVRGLRMGYGELALTNVYNSPTYTKVWTDMVIKPGRIYQESADGALKSDTTVAFFVTTNGQVRALNGAGWTTLNTFLGGVVTNAGDIPALSTNDWVRFVVMSDYGTDKWSLWMVTNALANTNALARLIGANLSFTNPAASYRGMTITNFNDAGFNGYLDNLYITLSAPESIDSDGDFLPDPYEERFGLTSPTNTTMDSDGDGFTDFEEFVMNTDPTNAGSFAHIENTDLDTPSGNDVDIAFEAGPGRHYSVVASHTPATEWYIVGDITTPSGATGITVVVTDTNAVNENDKKFFLVVADYMGYSITNEVNRYAMYRQSRTAGQLHYVGVPVDYGTGSNGLHQTLGEQLKRGLAGGTNGAGDELYLVSSTGAATNQFLLSASRTWLSLSGFTAASNQIPPGSGVIIRRRTNDTDRANAVFCGRARSGAGFTNSPLAIVTGWSLLSWPHDYTNSNWQFNGQGSATQDLADTIMLVQNGNFVELRRNADNTWRYEDTTKGAFVPFPLQPGDAFYYNSKGTTNFLWNPPAVP